MFRQRNMLFHFSLRYRPRSIRIPEGPALKARFMTEASSSLLRLTSRRSPLLSVIIVHYQASVNDSRNPAKQSQNQT